MENENLILSLLKDIHADQKTIMDELKTLTINYNKLRNDLDAGRNGYEPHEVVELLHYTKQKKDNEAARLDKIKTSFISWIVPIVTGIFILGLVQYFR